MKPVGVRLGVRIGFVGVANGQNEKRSDSSSGARASSKKMQRESGSRSLSWKQFKAARDVSAARGALELVTVAGSRKEMRVCV